MKQDSLVSKFLKFEVKKTFSGADVEICALPSESKGKPPKEYQEVVNKLTSAKEVGPNGSMVRFAGKKHARHLFVIRQTKDKKGINSLGELEVIRRLGAVIFNKLESEKVKSAVVLLDTFSEYKASISELTYALAEGMGLAAYRFDKYKTEKQNDKKADPRFSEVVFISSAEKKVKQAIEGIKRAEAMLAGAYVCRDFSNEPSNHLYPELFAERIKKLCAQLKLKCTVLDEQALKKEKMGLLLGVGQGSKHPPRLIAMEYTPARAKKYVALVGKGVTFDSGGISIKPSSRMEDMKHDMSGAAAVVGAMVSIALLKLPVKVITVVGAAENMPDGGALNPGNVITSRSGKTVEVTNTDAEGRLVLGDALDWAQDKKPDFIVDLATLTGAATVTLGKICAALLSNDSKLAKDLMGASKNSGERLWELPLFDEYFEELRSEYADMKNSGDTAANGTAKGAMFLQKFIRKETKWAHLDIASVAYGVTYAPYLRRSSSAFGVRLLVELLRG
ncbi:MAG: leucyl aminopeptidase [Bacteriovoracia bacterium]